MFGCHLSIAGGLHNALDAARALRADCVQLFTQNQRQWRSRSLSAQELALWRDHRRQADLAAIVSHASYLVNLASPDDETWRRSVGAYRAELERCEALAIPLAVVHPGSDMGAGERAGCRRVAEAIDQLCRDLPGHSTVICLESTAGQGHSVGWRFEQLRQIRDNVAQPERVAFCLDSAHLLAAGYALTSAARARAVLDEADHVLGLGNVRVWHVNDSKTPRGSRVDRHEHIGHGRLARTALGVIVGDPRFVQVPKILETPKAIAPDGRSWDEVNLQALRRLASRRGRGKIRRGNPGRRTVQ